MVKQKHLSNSLGVKRPGLFVRFIERLADEHVEPQRQGVARGDPIGFGRSKHVASLLSLTSLPVKLQATIAGVSFGLLRKWRTEADFKRAINFHARKFADEVAGWIKTRLANDAREVDAIMKLPPHKIAKAEIFHDRYSSFSDGSLYSDELITALKKRFFPHGVKVERTAVGAEKEALEIFDLIQMGKGQGAPFHEESERAWHIRSAAALKVAMNRISKKDRSEADLKDAVFFIRLVEQELERRSPYWEEDGA